MRDIYSDLLFVGTPITDSAIANSTKGLSLVERIGSTANVGQPASASATNATIVTNTSSANVGVQNVQVRNEFLAFMKNLGRCLNFIRIVCFSTGVHSRNGSSYYVIVKCW